MDKMFFRGPDSFRENSEKVIMNWEEKKSIYFHDTQKKEIFKNNFMSEYGREIRFSSSSKRASWAKHL